MRYVIDKTSNDILIIDDSLVISSGFSVSCFSKIFPIKKFYINDQTFIDEYVKIKINKKLIKLLNRLSDILSNDNSDGDGTEVLSGLEELKRLLLKEYFAYMSKKEYNSLQEKINIIGRDLEYSLNRTDNGSLDNFMSLQDIEMRL